jgi:LmbE family N-acetylglucosaminyl deacetylase
MCVARASTARTPGVDQPLLAPLLAATPSRAIAIYAHPDDADVSCGGTLARWAAAGAVVQIVVCATGDKGASDPNVDPNELAKQRAAEMSESAAVLGARGVRQLKRPDGEVVNDDALRADLVAVIRELQPEVVVCPDPLAVFFGELYYNHRDHREVGFAALDAAASASAPLYYPGAGAAHRVDTVLMSGTLEPTVWVDVSASIEVKAAAVECHRSQLGDRSEWFRSAVLERAEQTGEEVGVAHAESFRRLVLA